MNPNPKGVDNIGRKKWDKELYQSKALSRLTEEKLAEIPAARKAPEPVKTLKDLKPVQAREESVYTNLESNVGKKYGITDETSQGGFYCDVCDCLVKDSLNYLDHINGRKHQRALGTSLAADKASLEQVRERFRLNKLKRKAQKDPEEDFEQRMARLLKEKEEARLREEMEKKQKKQEEKEKRKQGKSVPLELENDPELSAMGLPMGFGTSKK